MEVTNTTALTSTVIRSHTILDSVTSIGPHIYTVRTQNATERERMREGGVCVLGTSVLSSRRGDNNHYLLKPYVLFSYNVCKIFLNMYVYTIKFSLSTLVNM